MKPLAERALAATDDGLIERVQNQFRSLVLQIDSARPGSDIGPALVRYEGGLRTLKAAHQRARAIVGRIFESRQ